jgi:hypothetical protein
METVSYYSTTTEDNRKGWSEEDQSFYKKISSPAQTPGLKISKSDFHHFEGPPGWRDFIKGSKVETYSPTLTNMANNYDKTPQVTRMYKEPDFDTSFWRHSPTQTPGPNKTR